MKLLLHTQKFLSIFADYETFSPHHIISRRPLRRR